VRPPEESAAYLAAFDREVAALYAEGQSVLARAYVVGNQAIRTAL
jgi:hypothetical protein